MYVLHPKLYRDELSVKQTQFLIHVFNQTKQNVQISKTFR